MLCEGGKEMYRKTVRDEVHKGHGHVALPAYRQALDVVDVRTARVSKALWPLTSRRAFTLNRDSLKHRRLAGLGRCWAWLARMFGGSQARAVDPGSSPETPMPLEPPLVRVLETVDLSRLDAEDLFEPQQERDTAEFSSEYLRGASSSCFD